MPSKCLILCLLLVAACGGSPTPSDPIVTMIGDGAPESDAGPIGVVDPPPANDGGRDAKVDADSVPTEDAGDAGTPVPAPDAGPTEDAGPKGDAGPKEDAGPSADAGHASITNDAGMPLCCSQLPILNASGIPVGTMPPQPCETWGVPDGGYPVGTVVCGIAVDPVDFTCVLKQPGQSLANQGSQTVCP